jgi:glyoxylase-like metal-dependent hydrolase (beta-lactamase superfamily II)
MTPKLRRRLLIATVVPLALCAVLSIAGRVARRRTSPTVTVGAHILHERNLFADLYGARIADGVILFDAGVDPAGGALDRLLADLGATRSDVRQVFLTHGHFDHVAAAPLCSRAIVRIGALDVDLLAQRVRPPLIGFIMRSLMPVGPIDGATAMPGRVDIDVGGGARVTAIPTPGHTPGSYVFVYDGVLFAGDTLIIDGDRLDYAVPAFSVDPPQNRRSVATLVDALQGLTVERVCTGHQGCTPPGRATAMLAELAGRARSGR